MEGRAFSHLDGSGIHSSPMHFAAPGAEGGLRGCGGGPGGGGGGTFDLEWILSAWPAGFRSAAGPPFIDWSFATFASKSCWNSLTPGRGCSLGQALDAACSSAACQRSSSDCLSLSDCPSLTSFSFAALWASRWFASAARSAQDRVSSAKNSTVPSGQAADLGQPPDRSGACAGARPDGLVCGLFLWAACAGETGARVSAPASGCARRSFPEARLRVVSARASALSTGSRVLAPSAGSLTVPQSRSIFIALFRTFLTTFGPVLATTVLGPISSLTSASASASRTETWGTGAGPFLATRLRDLLTFATDTLSEASASTASALPLSRAGLQAFFTCGPADFDRTTMPPRHASAAGAEAGGLLSSGRRHPRQAGGRLAMRTVIPHRRGI
mmetsp:Transcript_1696/g.5042  ORF Transcript_1696/g.5042 Transcript_1696/m.5042 type:complete len:386 (+) Transcript_1696:330-1487(+)